LRARAHSCLGIGTGSASKRSAGVRGLFVPRQNTTLSDSCALQDFSLAQPPLAPASSRNQEAAHNIASYVIPAYRILSFLFEIAFLDVIVLAAPSRIRFMTKGDYSSSRVTDGVNSFALTGRRETTIAPASAGVQRECKHRGYVLQKS